jgi:pseudouridine-5'-phosphate glycosidase
LGRTPVAVVCAGAKNLLDLGMTLEVLETQAVPVIGFQTDEFPAFYVRSSGHRLETRLDTPEQIATLLAVHWDLGAAGVVIAQPPPTDFALAPTEFDSALTHAEGVAARQGITGKALTPFLLAQIAERTQGRTLALNQALVIANARLAARIAAALVRHTS